MLTIAGGIILAVVLLILGGWLLVGLWYVGMVAAVMVRAIYNDNKQLVWIGSAGITLAILTAFLH